MNKELFKSDGWENNDVRKWRALNVAEYSWMHKTRDQMLAKIDTCLLRSCNAKSTWAIKYWHGVAEALGEKYVD